MNSQRNLIHDPKARSDRKLQKEKLCLRFLRQHIWSSQGILQQVMGLASRQATHKTLVNLEKMGLLRRYIYDGLGQKFTIWGISHQGQLAAFNLNYEKPVATYFEPSRVSEQTIRHQLDLQNLRLAAEKNGWTNWVDGDRLDTVEKNRKRPDAIAHNGISQVIAVECERTFKSMKRYEQILVQYLIWIKTGDIHKVVWVCPTADMAKRLKIIFTSFNYVRISGQKVLIEPHKHHIHLHFCSYEDWPTYE